MCAAQGSSFWGNTNSQRGRLPSKPWNTTCCGGSGMHCTPSRGVCFQKKFTSVGTRLCSNLYVTQVGASSQDKFEVIALIFQYWTHGSHPPREAMRPIVPITTEPVVTQHMEQHDDPVQTEAMLAIWAELCKQVPDVADPEREVDAPELCESCNRNPMCEYTPPECLSCYREH